MPEPLQIRIARSGKEIGTFDSAEALRLLAVGTLKPTDHYWTKGMQGWEQLAKLVESESQRVMSENHKKLNEESEMASRSLPEKEAAKKQEKLVRVRVRKATLNQEAYLQFLGATIPPGMSSDEASRAIDEIHDKGGYRQGWSFQKHVLYPHLYPGVPTELIDAFKLYVKSQVVNSSERLTDVKIQSLFNSLCAKNSRWWHPESRLEIAYQQLNLQYPACCNGRMVRQYGELPDSLHNYVRSVVIGCSEKLSRGRIIDVIEALCIRDQEWMNKPSRNESFWEELKLRFPGCCDGHAPTPSEREQSSGPSIYSGSSTPLPMVNRSTSPSKTSGCILFLFAVPSASFFIYMFCR